MSDTLVTILFAVGTALIVIGAIVGVWWDSKDQSEEHPVEVRDCHSRTHRQVRRDHHHA